MLKQHVVAIMAAGGVAGFGCAWLVGHVTRDEPPSLVKRVDASSEQPKIADIHHGAPLPRLKIDAEPGVRSTALQQATGGSGGIGDAGGGSGGSGGIVTQPPPQEPQATNPTTKPVYPTGEQ